MRNDHQDALGLGLAVVEYAPSSKSADEIRGLWQWVENKLTADEQPMIGEELPASSDLASPMYLPTASETVLTAS
jgi:chromosome partitioning protein